MQKKLIALAVAGLVSAPAFAQSNVTIYGVADAGIGIGSYGDNDFRGVLGGVLSTNRVGFKGTEDLGNGLKAVFLFEQGFDIGNGNASDAAKAFQRQAFVGLQGAFGTVALGRQYAPGYFQQYDAIASSSALSPQFILGNGAGLTIAPVSLARWDNSVTYSNTFANVVKVNAIYAARGNENGGAAAATDPDNDNSWGVGVEYVNAGLRVGGVFHSLKDQTTGGDNTREWLVGASYNFGMATVAGSYQRGSDLGNADLETDVWQIGAIVPVSAAGNVHVAYGRAEAERGAGLSDDEPSSWTVAYLHALSKRTTAYVGFNRTANDVSASYLPLGMTAGAEGVGEDSNLFTAGIRHTF